MLCCSCGGSLEARRVTFETNVCGNKVRDGGGIIPVCASCGEQWPSLRDLNLYELRAAAEVLRHEERVSGAVLRFARKALGMLQTELAERLGHSPETLSRWENGKAEIPKSVPLAMVGLLNDRWHQIYSGEAERSASPSDPLEVHAPPMQQCKACA